MRPHGSPRQRTVLRAVCLHRQVADLAATSSPSAAILARIAQFTPPRPVGARLTQNVPDVAVVDRHQVRALARQQFAADDGADAGLECRRAVR